MPDPPSVRTETTLGLAAAYTARARSSFEPPLEATTGAVAGAAAGVSSPPARPVPSSTAATSAADTVPPPMAASRREPARGGGAGAGGGDSAKGGRGGGGGVWVRVGGPSVQRRSMSSPEGGCDGDGKYARVRSA